MFHPSIAALWSREEGYLYRVYRYTDPAGKADLVWNEALVRDPKVFQLYHEAIERNFYSLTERLGAIQLLAHLSSKGYDTAWKPVNKGARLLYSLGMPSGLFYTVWEKLIAARLLLVLNPIKLYRLSTMNDAKDKRHIAEAYKEQSGELPSKTKEPVPLQDMNFTYLEDLSNVNRTIQNLVTLQGQMRTQLSEATLAMQALYKREQSIENSDISFLRLNELFQQTRKELADANQVLDEVSDYLERLNEEPLSGEAMRLIRMMRHSIESRKKP